MKTTIQTTETKKIPDDEIKALNAYFDKPQQSLTRSDRRLPFLLRFTAPANTSTHPHANSTTLRFAILDEGSDNTLSVDALREEEDAHLRFLRKKAWQRIDAIPLPEDLYSKVENQGKKYFVPAYGVSTFYLSCLFTDKRAKQFDAIHKVCGEEYSKSIPGILTFLKEMRPACRHGMWHPALYNWEALLFAAFEAKTRGIIDGFCYGLECTGKEEKLIAWAWKFMLMNRAPLGRASSAWI